MSESISQKYTVIPWPSLKRLVNLGYKEKSKTVWQEIMELRNEINENWQGPGAIEEIRNQRAK